jgi:hypothetical protein
LFREKMKSIWNKLPTDGGSLIICTLNRLEPALGPTEPGYSL